MKNNVNSKKKSKPSRVRRPWALVAVLAVAIAAVVVARIGFHAAPAPIVVTRPVRVQPPAPPWTPAQVTELRRTLNDAFAPARGTTYSLVVLDALGRVLYDDEADRAVTPASVQKLIVADTALNLLGPRYRFHTLLASQHGLGGDGTIDGDLMLVGSGDPSLRSEDLAGGVRSLDRAGVRAITGGVAVDPTAMHGPEINPNWSAADAGEDYQTATSAISLDGDTAEFRVYGSTPGAAARVDVVPHSRMVRLLGSITTSDSDSVIIAPQDDPNTFALSGTIPAQDEEKFLLPVHDIPAYAGDVLDGMLQNAGISRGRRPVIAPAPLDAVSIWDHRSAPVRDLIGHMLFVSDNHYAEQLLRTLGGDEGTAPDDQSGIAVERAFLTSRGIPTKGLHVLDGSGLAEGNRVSAMTLARVLSDAQQRGGDEDLYLLLPQGGRNGTLKHYDFTTALGRVRAKTGHLSDAASLAGYVNSVHHGRLVFAFMINDSPSDPDGAYVNAVDRLADF